jgi:hypothetical protein
MANKQKRNQLLFCPKCHHKIVRFAGALMVRLEQIPDRDGLSATFNNQFECDGCGHKWSLLTTVDTDPE